ncbi:hypothetical protein B0T21DRAFT_337286 [Apiosordaria backusii]|uniref:Secreted protein n=1 Tax=Apiosordaria backusii TaxID=314023 RepID=A0AA40AX94_9PEZI|nr:hypothetical protein B0T21DRAFT_337286 [Apiosordaria backusii]
MATLLLVLHPFGNTACVTPLPHARFCLPDRLSWKVKHCNTGNLYPLWHIWTLNLTKQLKGHRIAAKLQNQAVCLLPPELWIHSSLSHALTVRCHSYSQ